jgi:hypothetical protein
MLEIQFWRDGLGSAERGYESRLARLRWWWHIRPKGDKASNAQNLFRAPSSIADVTEGADQADDLEWLLGD